MRFPGAKALVIYNKKLLLILRDNNPNIPAPNTWNLPGGGIEENESPKEALKRELWEEINIVPQKINFLGKQTYNDGSITYRFLVKLTKSEFKNIKLGDEGQRLDFFTVDEAMELPYGGYLKEYFFNYKDKLKQLIEENKQFPPADLGLES